MPQFASLEGLSAIVTGSSSGIGRSIALAFAREGAKHVICVDIDPKPPNLADSKVDPKELHYVVERELNEELITTHDLIRQRHGQDKASFFKCDVSIESVSWGDGPQSDRIYGMADLMAEAMPILGRLDIMVNSAAIGIFAIPTHEMTMEVWHKSMSVNSGGAFLGMKHSLAQFVKQEPDIHGFRGTIINISGIGAKVGIRECGAYTASMAAIAGLAKTVAVDYAAQGIRCNVLCPGYIRTPMLQPSLEIDVGFEEYLDTWIPMRRIGRPRDVAGAAVWLANNQHSGYITGITLDIDGGFLAR